MRPFLNVPFHILCVAAVALVAAGCSDDSSSPQDTGPGSFSKLFGAPTHDTIPMGVAVLSDDTRVVFGAFDGFLHVSGADTTIASGGGLRCFIASFRPDGKLGLFTQIGGGAADMRRMARDRDDNLWLIGGYSGSTSHFGNFAQPPSVNTDLIFAKLDRAGHVLMVQTASAAGDDDGMDVATAGDGTVYLCGIASDEMSVAGEDVGQSGHGTGYVAALTSGAAGIFTKTATVTGGKSACNAISASENGTVVVCGSWSGGSLAFAATVVTNDGSTDSFVQRFASDGTDKGIIHIGGADDLVAEDVTTLDNDVVVTGLFTGDADFDVKTAGGDRTASGTANAFVARYSPGGTLRWVKTFGPGNNQFASSVSRLSGGQILLCGTFADTITLGSTTLTSGGFTDAFVARLDGDGKVLSAGRLGGSDSEGGIFATTTGSTAIIMGSSGSSEITFPDGSHHTKFGTIDTYVFQQP